MDHRRNPEAGDVRQASSVPAAAAKGVARLESIANKAFCCRAALAGMLARLEGPAGSREPTTAEAAVLDSATVCREASAIPQGGCRRGKGGEARRRPAAASPEPSHRRDGPVRLPAGT
jgi:hypothetical protein